MTEPDVARSKSVVETITATATVVAIDPARRTVALKREDGGLTTYKAGPEVINFDQIQVGDEVKATVVEEIAVYLVKGGMQPGAARSSTFVRAPKGAKPGFTAVDTFDLTAEVAAINVEQRLVTLKLPDGATKIVRVGPAVDLKGVVAGDKVAVQVTQSVALQVEKP